MDIIYLLIPLALVLVVAIVAAFFWAVRSGQFDDLEGPAFRIIMDDEVELHATVNEAGGSNAGGSKAGSEDRSDNDELSGELSDEDARP